MYNIYKVELSLQTEFEFLLLCGSNFYLRQIEKEVCYCDSSICLTPKVIKVKYILLNVL